MIFIEIHLLIKNKIFKYQWMFKENNKHYRWCTQAHEEGKKKSVDWMVIIKPYIVTYLHVI